MSGLDKIKRFLNKYEQMFFDMDDFDDFIYPFVVSECQKLNYDDYYSFDFSKKNVILLFSSYNGDSVFVVLYPPQNEKNFRYDECPVYLFDEDNKSIDKIGNFKTYIITLLSYIDKTDPNYRAAIKDLSRFSDKILEHEFI